MTTSSWNREKWSRVWAEHKWAIFNIIVLAWAWSLGEGAFFIQVSTTSLAATAFQYQSISTIPIGCMLLIATIVSLILPPAIKRVGHRIPLTIGALLGAVGACVCIAATWNRSYGWLVVGATLIGFQVPCTLYYRLLALQFSPPEFAPYAIALVVAGGCISSILGPEFAKQTVNAFTKQYAGSYLTTVAECATLAILMSIVMQWNKGGKKHTSTLESETITSTAADVAINIDKEKSTSEHTSRDSHDKPIANEAIEREEVSAIRFHDQSYAEDTLTSSETTTAIPITISDPIKTTSEETRVSNASDAAPVAAHDHPIVRSIWQIATDNNYDFIVAVLGGAVSWSGMALLMSATPLSMKGHKYVYDQSTSAIEVHLVGMFLPSIFSGLLIKKFGPRIILSLGLAIIIIGGATFNTGYALANYYGPITVVGVGWNFGYVGGSSLMATTYRNELEKVKAHSVYETIVMIGITISFFTSGFALTGLGWNWFTGLVVIYVGVIWLFVCLHSLYVYVNRTEPNTATAAPTKTLHTSSSTSEQQIPVQV